jgi:glyoxylase-like metal-dependent hydrolase (beta-lactamase superfamily II)
VSARSQPSWDTPGTFEVAAGVHRIPLPLPGDGLKAVNVYVIKDGDQLALVDTGSFRRESVRALEQGLATLGASLADISVVLATHAHYDHYGLVSKIRASSGAEVVLGDQEIELLRVAIETDIFERWVEHRRAWLGRHGAFGLVGAIEGFERHQQLEAAREDGRWERPDRVLADGETVELRERTLQARWTPGHTRGHIVYHDREHGLLFAGDHVLPHITPSLGFEPFTDGRALELFLGSLAAIRDVPVESVLPGHGPVFSDLAGRVDELEHHHQLRLASCVAVISDEGARSANAVARSLTWTSRRTRFSELDPFNRMLAVTETVTHLELLVQSGRLKRDEADGDVFAYALAA